jgi:hypothetical protein
MTTVRYYDMVLVCEICEGEVDLHDHPSAQCRHCGIAYAVDLPELEQLSRGA